MAAVGYQVSMQERFLPVRGAGGGEESSAAMIHLARLHRIDDVVDFKGATRY